MASRRPRMSGSCCARLRRANVEFAAVERRQKQSCQNPSKSLAPWPERLHMRPVLHTQKHGWRLRCAASLLRFARQPCFCVCSTWPHVQTGRLLALPASLVSYRPLAKISPPTEEEGSRLGIGFELRIVIVLGERNELLRHPGSCRRDTRGDSPMTSVAVDV